MHDAPPLDDPASSQPTIADGSWMAWAAAGVGGIWVAAALIGFLAPDMVTGSEQQHMPIAAMTSWLWGLGATAAFLWAMGRLRGRATRRPIWIGLATATLIVWLVATIVGTTAPVLETGSDPTRIPLGALIGPMGAAALTVLTGVTASVFARTPPAR
ncbi:MAG TPA: hypothetical protein VFZ77_14285 [Acidimicrobiales bacterium]